MSKRVNLTDPNIAYYPTTYYNHQITALPERESPLPLGMG